MKVTIVGCSGSFPGPDSPSSSYLVEAEDDERVWRVLLDLGSGSLGPLQRLIDLDHLDAVVISHLHPDHFMDLCGLYVARRYLPSGDLLPPLPIYGPENIARRFADAYGGNPGEDFSEVYDFRELTDGAGFEVGPISVLPRLVEHPVEAYGLRLEHFGRTFAYSGDTDTCDNLLELARGVNLLLCEASFQEGRDDGVRGVHLTGRRAGEVAAKAAAHRLVLTHIPVWTDRDVVRAEAAEVFTGPIEVARPLVSYVLAGFPGSHGSHQLTASS